MRPAGLTPPSRVDTLAERELKGTAENASADEVLPLRYRAAQPPLPPSLPPSLREVGPAAQQRLGVQQRRSATIESGQTPSARCQPGGNASGTAGRQPTHPPPLRPRPLLSPGRRKLARRRRSREAGLGGGSGGCWKDARHGGPAHGCMLAPRTVPQAPLAGSATCAST